MVQVAIRTVGNILQKGFFCRTMSPVQMSRQLKTLDNPLAQAEHYANHSTRNIGLVPLKLFLIGAYG
jgi:hypothetical protein